MKTIRTLILAASFSAGIPTGIFATAPAFAQTPSRFSFHLPSQPLAASLRAVALASGRSIGGSTELVGRKVAPAIDGTFTAKEAVEALLVGSGLRARVVGTAFVIERADTSSSLDLSPASTEGEVVITGSRIRGAPVSSEIIKLDRAILLDTGKSTVAEALRTLPQNFGGGQNPGVGFNVPATSGEDIGGGSSVNLRGLGSDATLTLLDGRRVSYNAAHQSVDISAIPFNAIARIDVVPDGSSALFGSDAVAGVVNVILRRDWDGLEMSARVGGSTDGGNFEQQYSATGGRTWAGGGLLLAYEYGSNSRITDDQRSYGASRPGLTVYPELRHHNALATFRQDLGSGLSVNIDGLFDKRWENQAYPLNFAGDLSVSKATFFSVAQSFGVSPSLIWTAPAGWEATLAGTYGQDKVLYGGIDYEGSVGTDAGSGFYRNRAENIELAGNGPLFDIGEHAAKLAVGVGYRRNSFIRFTSNNSQDIRQAQRSDYAFGELSLPLLAGAEGAANLLTASAALRHEHYAGIASVTTPKLGLIFSPSRDFDIKGSWGRSFRAPTLYEQYTPQASYLIGAGSVGGGAFPAGSTAILLTGGNPHLKPERSSNWSATLDAHPRPVRGLDLALTYFAVEYTNRVVTPIQSFATALSDPVNASRITLNPSSAAQSAFIAGAGSFIDITGGGGYDPSKVIALIDDSSVNAGRQHVHGIDLLANYSSEIGAGTLSLTGDASYLHSNQRIAAGLPLTPIAGAIFNPPHFRGYASASWKQGVLTLSADATYIGPVRDARSTEPIHVRGMTPVDLTIRVQRPSGRGLLDGLDLTLSGQNIFNAKPARIATTLFYDTPYDSTNYSPFGRVLSVTVARRW